MVPAVTMNLLLWWALGESCYQHGTKNADLDSKDSPRWLVARGRKAEALGILDRLRPEIDVDSGHTIVEIEAIEETIKEGLPELKGQSLEEVDELFQL